MREPPLVSAILPAWNAADFIAGTLESLAAQTYPNLEIVAGDDASGDATPDILQDWAASRPNVTLIRRRENLGWVANCNDLMSRARGAYMFFAFHDDQVDPTYVAELTDLLERDREAILAYSIMRWTDTDGRLELRDGAGTGLQDTPVARAAHMIGGTPHWGVPNRGVFRASAFHRIGGMKTHEAGELGADFPWLLHMTILGRFAHLSKPLCTKQMRPGSLSRSWIRNRETRIARNSAAMREIDASPLAPEDKLCLRQLLARAADKGRLPPTPPAEGDRRGGATYDNDAAAAKGPRLYGREPPSPGAATPPGPGARNHLAPLVAHGLSPLAQRPQPTSRTGPDVTGAATPASAEGETPMTIGDRASRRRRPDPSKSDEGFSVRTLALSLLPTPLAKVRMQKAMDARDHDGAIRIGKAILRRKPRSASILRSLAKAMANVGDHDSALQKIEAFHHAYGAPASLMEAGLDIARRSGSSETIEVWTANVLSVDPDSLVARHARFLSLCKIGKEREAHELMASATFSARASTRTVCNSVFALMRFGEYEKALEFLGKLGPTATFSFERQILSAILFTRVGNLRAACEHAIKASEAKPDDPRPGLAFHEIAEAFDQRGDADSRSTAEEYREKARRVFDCRPSAAVAHLIDESRTTLDTVLSTGASRSLLSEQPFRVSFACPVHRSADVPNIVKQVGQQTWKNAEVVFLPNGEVDASQIRDAWEPDCGIELVILDRAGAETLGDVLNRIADNCRGDYICRMDADNYYLPDYTAHMMASMMHFGADFVFKPSRFKYHRGPGIYCLDAGIPVFVKSENINRGGGGATFLAHRRIFEKVRFESLNVGEDMRFLAASRSAGFYVHYVDPFNFVSVREKDGKGHTWKALDIETLLFGPAEILGDSESTRSMVRYVHS